MKIYNYDKNFLFIDETELDESDICQVTGEFLIPGSATVLEPLPFKESFLSVFKFDHWEYCSIEYLKVKQIIGLLPGEFIQNEKVFFVEKPNDFCFWDTTKNEWLLDATSVKNDFYFKITSIYPEWRQNNILSDYLFDPNEENKKVFLEMRTFIENKKNECNEVINSVNKKC